MTQKQQILKHLIKHDSIHPREAMKLYSIRHLGSVIARLREDGHCIDNQKVEVGSGKLAAKVVNYVLISDGRAE